MTFYIELDQLKDFEKFLHSSNFYIIYRWSLVGTVSQWFLRMWAVPRVGGESRCIQYDGRGARLLADLGLIDGDQELWPQVEVMVGVLPEERKDLELVKQWRPKALEKITALDLATLGDAVGRVIWPNRWEDLTQ